MKYIKEFQSLALLQEWYHDKKYGEPNVFKTSNDSKIELNNGKYWILEFDTTKDPTGSGVNTLWTPYNNNTSNSHPDEVYIDGIKYDEHDNNGYLIPPAISSLSEGKHIVKLKFSDITKTGGSPVFYNNYLTKAHVPECVENLGNLTFMDCRGLESVNIPSKVTKLSYPIFARTSLKEITIPSNITYVDSNLFDNSTLETVHIYCTSLDQNSVCFGRAQYLKTAILHEGLTAINAIAAFAYNPVLENVTLPSTLTTIGLSAFEDCPSLKTIQLPENLTTIGKNAFKKCTNLTISNLPDNIVTIGDNAFEGCKVTSEALKQRILAINDMAFGFEESPQIKNTAEETYFSIYTEYSNTITYSKASSNPDLYYSKDNGETWTQVTTDISCNQNEIVRFKGTLTPSDSNFNYGIGTFTIDGDAVVFGNIMSLLYGDNFVNKKDLTGKPYAFYGLFNASNNKIIGAKNLILPATTLSDSCYRNMFKDCSALKTIPSLPATTLAMNCYHGMFNGCTGLTEIPEDLLPATVMKNECYEYMFNGCTSLTEIPENLLPATDLDNYCYGSMFSGCTGLTSIPSGLLPATISNAYDNYCYYSMFSGCTGLTSIPSGLLPSTTLASNCYGSMFNGCTGLTSIPADLLPATTLQQSCYDRMFGNCTGLTTVPSDLLPATTLVKTCYNCMFQSCSSLTVAPDLPATTLVDSCYQAMFAACTSLTYIKCLATDISAQNCLSNWTVNINTEGTFVKDATMNDWTTGSNGIPSNWTVQDAV